MSKIIITIEDVKETPASKPRVIASIQYDGKTARDVMSPAREIAIKAIELIDRERQKL